MKKIDNKKELALKILRELITNYSDRWMICLMIDNDWKHSWEYCIISQHWRLSEVIKYDLIKLANILKKYKVWHWSNQDRIVIYFN